MPTRELYLQHPVSYETVRNQPVPGNHRDAVVLEWKDTNPGVGTLSLFVQNTNNVDMVLRFFGSPDNEASRPYAPVSALIGGDTVATFITLTAGSSMSVVLPVTYATSASGRVEFFAVPNANDTVTIDDTDGNGPVVFTFVAGAPGSDEISLDAIDTAAEAATALLTAIRASVLDVDGHIHLSNAAIVDVWQLVAGDTTEANSTIATNASARISVSGFAGGSDSDWHPWLALRLDDAKRAMPVRLSYDWGWIEVRRSTEEQSKFDYEDLMTGSAE